MKNGKLQQLYEKLSLVSVFIGVWETPLFQAFENYCNVGGVDKKRAYARFVAEIYNGGGSLTRLVETQVFENENAYIKAAASGQECPSCIEEAAKKELELFSDFASLTRADFASDMEISEQEIPDFGSVNATLPATYQKRLQNIGKVGYGVFSTHGMFRLSDEKTIEPILSADKTEVDKFIGYEAEREKVMQNTRAFVENRPAANVLLYGDAGTGKSSTVKAVANAFYSEGVRLI